MVFYRSNLVNLTTENSKKQHCRIKFQGLSDKVINLSVVSRDNL